MGAPTSSRLAPGLARLRLAGLGLTFEPIHVGEAPGQDAGERVDVDHGELALVAAPQAPDELAAQEVELPVQQPPAVREIALLGAQILDPLLELAVGEGREVRGV